VAYGLLTGLVAGLAACGSGQSTSGPTDTRANVMALSVGGSQCPASPYLNEPCVSVTLCAPGTAICQTVGGLLLDTGSTGLRVFSSVLTTPGLRSGLTPVTAAGAPLAECIGFVDGSSQWGPVVLAELGLGGEARVSVPIQLADSSYQTPPSACAGADTSPQAAGFNGILGLAQWTEDCGAGCAASTSNGLYFACGVAGCTPSRAPLASQLQNPVFHLAEDNNGFVVKLPPVASGGAAAVEGQLVLGVGTRANNSPPAGLTVLPLDANLEFSTLLASSSGAAFADTGSNGYFFAAPSGSGLVECADAAGWYCPAATLSLQATNSPKVGSGSRVTAFQVGNFDSLTAPTSVGVSALLGGTAAAGTGFDWGLPFFLGRDVYHLIDGASSGLGLGPAMAY
jgi:hypothetical protein